MSTSLPQQPMQIGTHDLQITVQKVCLEVVIWQTNLIHLQSDQSLVVPLGVCSWGTVLWHAGCCQKAQTTPKQIRVKKVSGSCNYSIIALLLCVDCTPLHLPIELPAGISISPPTLPAVYQTVRLDLRVSARPRNAADSQLYPAVSQPKLLRKHSAVPAFLS